MGDESVLRARVREAMKTGKLPDYGPERLWGGLGSGEPCAVCGETVDREDVELELKFAAGRHHAATNYHVHARCFTAWELERRNRGSNCNPLPQGAEAGIMPSRERHTTDEGGRG